MNFIVKTDTFLYNRNVERVSDTLSLTTEFKNLGDKVSDDTKQTQEVKAKRTAKNSVFLDLFQDKKT